MREQFPSFSFSIDAQVARCSRERTDIIDSGLELPPTKNERKRDTIEQHTSRTSPTSFLFLNSRSFSTRTENFIRQIGSRCIYIFREVAEALHYLRNRGLCVYIYRYTVPICSRFVSTSATFSHARTPRIRPSFPGEARDEIEFFETDFSRCGRDWNCYFSERKSFSRNFIGFYILLRRRTLESLSLSLDAPRVCVSGCSKETLKEACWNFRRYYMSMYTFDADEREREKRLCDTRTGQFLEYRF